MGDLAASGGYYIAAPADVVFADPSTLTGSIGVFGFKVDAGNLMSLLGLNVETTRRGAHADYLSPYRPWTEAEVRMVTEKIRHIYGLFLETVATGRRSRGLTVARVDELGRGQIWTGARAQTLRPRRSHGRPLRRRRRSRPPRPRAARARQAPRDSGAAAPAVGAAAQAHRRGRGARGEGGRQRGAADEPKGAVTAIGRALLVDPRVARGDAPHRARY